MEVFSWESSGDWHLNLQSVHSGFVSGTSSGKMAAYSLEKYNRIPIVANLHAHEGAINQMARINEHVVGSVSSDGLKVWDLRVGLAKSQMNVHNSKKSKFLSVACGVGGDVVAGGTELVGVDAEVHIWDLKKAMEPVRSFVDSHHDDVTDLEFHGSRNYLMSGSTDGYVNVYNLDEPDEDEALHQVINFASVHQCTFLQPHRIGVLSHMETFGVFELNSTDYENSEEPDPHVFGDVRSIWPKCEYVIGVSREGRGHVAYGANSESSLTVVPFDVQNERLLMDHALDLPGGHGEEVVRDLLVLRNNRILSCGEDGLVKAWEASLHLTEVEEEEKESGERKKEKKEKKDKKERRKERKEKKEKNRFKPY